MASSNPKADQLAKSLQLALSNSLGGIKYLRQMGWFDKLQEDWPLSSVSWVVAHEALFLFGFDDNGRWNKQHGLITGLLLFLKQQTGRFPNAVDLNDLKSILESDPVDRRGVEQWFSMIYG